jgi:hypothetical protein
LQRTTIHVCGGKPVDFRTLIIKHSEGRIVGFLNKRVPLRLQGLIGNHSTVRNARGEKT